MNAKQEFIEHVDERNVLCATVKFESFMVPSRKYFLPQGGNLQEFLDQLNFDYDDGYGRQNLFGTIWYEDGSYSERREYDGSEWWEHYEVPEIPHYLRGVQAQ
jgi:hypothetical protein